ncbi:hypothetical protein PMAYCL1PPCAC_32262, partial [Pristionchus mayeri]
NNRINSLAYRTMGDKLPLAVTTRPEKTITVVEVDAKLLFLVYFISVASAQPAESRLLRVSSVDRQFAVQFAPLDQIRGVEKVLSSCHVFD